MMPLQYFHLPIILPKNIEKTLEGCVIAISTYSGKERVFLMALTNALGAT